MPSKLYNTLERTFNAVFDMGGVYILPMFGFQFGIQETNQKINLIYKGKILKSYSNTTADVRMLLTILYESIFAVSWSFPEMTTSISRRKITWKSPNPFSSGTLSIGENECIDKQLTISDMVEEIFSRYPHFPLLVFKYEKQRLIYINRNI